MRTGRGARGGATVGLGAALRGGWALLAATACAPLGGGPPVLIDGDGFFDRPFPDDRRRVGGAPDLSDFPLVDDYALLPAYVEEAAQLDGFGLTSPLTLRFDGALPEGALPTPAGSMAKDASLSLINVDPRSPRRGQRTPLRWGITAEATRWQPAGLLSVAPIWGAVLEPGTEYALVLRRSIARPPAGWRPPWSPDGAADPSPDGGPQPGLRHLWAVLFAERADLEDIAYAVTFTTQDPHGELARIALATEAMALGPLDQPVSERFRFSAYSAYEGGVSLVNWQHGEAPYALEEGGFSFDAGGEPIAASGPTVRFTVSVPAGEAPAAGWPVVLVIHGTGSTHQSFANSRDRGELAWQLAEAGLAGISISLPFHGDRATTGGQDFLSFNVLNPTAGRTNLRQAAAEALHLAHRLAGRTTTLQVVDGRAEGTAVRLDGRRMAYLGHSHGAQIATMAAPFFPPEVGGVVLSGAGGGLAISLVERDAGDFDIQGLVKTLLDFTPDEALDDLHPIAGLVQLFGEASDPLVYGPLWSANDSPWPTRPMPVLMFEGLQDIYTPPRSAESLAGAARLPPLGEDHVRTGALKLCGRPTGALPASGNVRAWDGEPLTTGLLQYPAHGHFAIFEDDGAQAIYRGFLAGAVDGAPVIQAHPE